MDFDSELSQIQGALMKANNSHNFMDLKYRAGNTKEIQFVVDVLFKLLSDKGYISEDSADLSQHSEVLRKITFFLILNSDIIVLTKMVDSDEIGHIIWVTPLISKCVLISLITGLNLNSFYCEAITYTYPLLAVQLFELAAENINYVKPERKTKQIRSLITSAYAMVSRFIEYPMEEDVCNKIFCQVYEKMTVLLKSFIEPPKKLTTGDKLDINEYCGHAQLNMLKMLINCFNIYSKQLTKVESSKFELYFTTYYEYDKTKIVLKNDDVIKGYLSKFNELLFEYATLSMMQITVTMFMCWFDYSDEESDITLQRSVGEHAYRLQELIKSNHMSENELTNMLDAISSKPLELDDFIKDADRNTFLTNANDKNNSKQKEWLTAMIKKDFVFQDKECIDCVMDNIDILQESDYSLIVTTTVNLLYSKIKNEYPECLKTLAMTVLSKLRREEQIALILSIFSEHEIGDVLESQDHQAQMTEYFNKLIDIDDPGKETNLYTLFIQNPITFCEKIVSESVKNSEQTNVMLKALGKLSIFKDVKIKFQIDKYKNVNSLNLSILTLNALNDINTEVFETELQCASYVHLMKGVIDNKIIDNEILLLKISIPKIQSNLTDRNLKGLLLQLRVLQEIFCADSYDKYLASLLAILSPVIERVRWDLKSFTATAVEVMQTAVNVQKTIMAAFIQRKRPTDSEFQWISSKLSTVSPMTGYYYQQLWPNTPFKGFFDKSMETVSLQITLCYLLPRCTLEEFKEISAVALDADDPKAGFKTLCDVLKLIGSASEELKLENSFNCVENCCRNLASIFQDLIKSENSATAKPSLVESVVDLLNSLPEHLQNRCFTCFMSVIAECCSSPENATGDMEAVKISLENIKNVDSKTIMFQLLSNRSG